MATFFLNGYLFRAASFFVCLLAIPDFQSYSQNTSAALLLDSARELENKGATIAAVQLYESVSQDKATDSNSKASAYKKLINIYGSVGNIEATLNTMALMNNLSKDSTIAMQLNLQLVHFLMQNKDWETAKTILRETYDYFLRHKNFLWMSKLKGTEGVILKTEGNFDSAKSKLEEAWLYLQDFRKICTAPSDDPGMADMECTTLNNTADLLITIGDYSEAIQLLDKTKPMLNFVRESTLAVINLSYAQAYQGLGKNREAAACLKKGITLIEKGNYQYLNPAYLELARILVIQGKHKNATEYFEQYIKHTEEAHTQDQLQKLGYARTQYLLEKKDKEILESELKLLKKSQQLSAQQKQTYFSIVGSLILLVISVLLYKNIRNKKQLLKTKSRMENTEKAMLEAEGILKGELQERSRIAKELHDNVVSELTILKLNLENLHKQADTLKSAEETRFTLLHSSEILESLRRTAHNMIPHECEYSTLAQQVGLLLSKIPDSGVKFSYHVLGEEPSLSPHKRKIILTILRELVNNIIRHSKATEALVQLHFCVDTIMLTVEDNGLGFNLKLLRKSEGMGWKNIQENIALVKGILDIKTSEHDGTNILIEIPVN